MVSRAQQAFQAKVEFSFHGRPPTRKQSQPGWQYLKVVKHRSGGRLTRVSIQTVYDDPEEVLSLPGQHTAYVERTHLTSRQMNGRLVRKTLSYFRQEEMLKAASAWEEPDPSCQNIASGDQRRASSLAASLTSYGCRSD